MNNPIIIRLAQPKDFERISEIAKDSFPLACPPDSDKSELNKYVSTKLNTEIFLEIHQDTANRIWVAEIDSKIVGFCLLSIINSSRAEISKIYLLQEHHGSGAARMLIESAITFAKSIKKEVVELSVFNGNERAKQFYKKFGFKFIRNVEFQMGSEIHNDDLMELKIA